MKVEDFNTNLCPLNNASFILGDRWVLLILRDIIFYDKSKYSHFSESEEGIATNILSNRLKRMVDFKLIEKSKNQYHLTLKGLSVLPLILELLEWSCEYNKHYKSTPEIDKALKNKEEFEAKIRAKFFRRLGSSS